MVSTELNQRRTENRTFLVRTLGAIARALGDDYRIQFPKDYMTEDYGEIVTPEGRVLEFWHGKHGAKQGQFEIRGELTVDGHKLNDYVSRQRPNPTICVTATRPAADIARDIHRRLIPEFTAVYNQALESWRASEANKRRMAVLGARFIDVSHGLITQHQFKKATSGTFPLYMSSVTDGSRAYGDIDVYESDVTLNLSNVPIDLALDFIKTLAAASGRRATIARKLNKISKPLTKRGKRK